MRKQRASRLRQFWGTCRERIRHLRLRRALGAYADGQLTGARHTRVAGHVDRCWTCSGELLVVRLIKASMRNRPRRAPASLAEFRIRRFIDRLTCAPARRR